jgi:hypothetical protein
MDLLLLTLRALILINRECAVGKPQKPYVKGNEAVRLGWPDGSGYFCRKFYPTIPCIAANSPTKLHDEMPSVINYFMMGNPGKVRLCSVYLIN